MGKRGSSDSKESACSEGDPGSTLGLGRCPGGGNGNLLQYSCLENSTERGAWQATVQGVIKSQTRLGDFQFHRNKKGKKSNIPTQIKMVMASRIKI